jgi:hypothetical protein
MHIIVTKWSEQRRWDYKSARAASHRIRHPEFIALADCICDATVLVDPRKEPGHEWPVYGVNNINGVFFSHRQPGSEFNSNYKRIKKDWFFHNPTRANVGSLGRVPDIPEDAVTSPEYQVWRVFAHFSEDFIEVLIKTPSFLELIDCHRVGGVKERLFTANLLEITVPRLSPEAQESMIREVHNARKTLRSAEEALRATQAQAGERISRLLG